MSRNHDRDIARQGRQAGLAIAFGGLLAILAPAIVRWTGLAPRVEFLLYLVSLACFIWSLAVTWRIWQKTRD